MANHEQQQSAQRFRALHVSGDPLVLFNVWDAGSAKTLAKAGAKALATSSWSVAAANGFGDGEQVPLEAVIENARRIANATDLPLTVDLESGYADIAETVRLVIEAGAIGCNLEDSIPGDGRLRPIEEQCERLRLARQAADAILPEFFINLRTDVFFQKPADQHDDAMIADALERAQAYAKAGANGLFAPGLTNLDRIATLAEASPLPLNVMVTDATAIPRTYAERSVARVSYGPAPYIAAMAALEQAARVVLE
jgi:methylisocitrate lyase